jgi:hypothetical protein
MYRGNVIVSAKAAGYSNSNYYVDGTTSYPETSELVPFVQAIQAVNTNANVIYSSNSSNAVITTGSDLKGYVGWGIHNGVWTHDPYYATDRSVVWSGNSNAWWIIETIESYNGQRDSTTINGQGDVEEWFAVNAWGGANYTNTPVGAVSYVEEPDLIGVNGATYMSLWEEGFLFSECAWASKNTPCFQAIGDPLIKQ